MDNNIFEVGLPIAIETYYKSYLSTELIGWKQDVYLITGIVQTAGKTGQLKVKEHCKMRFLKDGIAYGFETKILAINFYPFPIMFSKFPKAIEQFTVRKSNRITVNLPAKFLDKNDQFIAHATITDISAGGCGLTIPLDDAKDLACENTYRMIFSAMDSDIHISCAVRKMKPLKDKSELGIEFINLSLEEKERIKSFLDFCANVATSRLDFILAKMKKTEKILAGNLNEISLIDMLQIFEQLDKQGTIHVTSGRQSGYIAIKDGMVVDATLDNIRGEDALVDLLSLKEGDFHVSSIKVIAGHMNRPINFVLMDTCRLVDEKDSMKEYFPGREEKLVLETTPDLDDSEAQTVIDALRNGASSVSEINEATGLTLIRSGLISARLIKEGYLTKTS